MKNNNFLYKSTFVAINTFPPTVTDDPNMYFKTVKELVKETYSLQDQHRAYLRNLERETKYGSKYVLRFYFIIIH